MNIREEILKLSSTAPVFKDQDDDFDFDETTAKIDSKSTEYNDDLDTTTIGNRRIRPALADLTEYGKRYKGKKVSRQNIQDFASDQEDDLLDEDELSENNDEDEEESDEEEADKNDEEDDEEGDEEEDDDADENENEDNERPKKKSKLGETDDNLQIFSSDRTEEIEKGKVVRSQLKLWEMLLETRVKLQNLLNLVNQFPQHDSYDGILQNLTPDLKESTEVTLKENRSYLTKTFNQMADIQRRLFQTDPDTHYMLSISKETKNSALKRKHSQSDEEELNENEDTDDDEEIYSDTDEEMQANERKKRNTEAKTPLALEQKLLKPDQFEASLEAINKNFQKYRNATIQKWYDKTRLVTTKSFQSFEKPILQQIDHLLMDKERLIKRTQLKRSVYEICGKTNVENDDNQKSLEEMKDRHLKDYDEEIYDDQDFYNQLMRELIDRQTNNVLDPVELSRKSIELQNLRNKNKKKVDTKASKGRKIKFDVHKPMVNFMAPIFKCKMADEARSELFRSLFADHIKLLTSNENLSSNVDNNDVDFNFLFNSISSK